METVTMTVHQALCEVKTSDKRIQRAIQEGRFVTTNRKSNTKIEGIDIKSFEERMKSDLQRVTDLIRRTEAIKAALSLSNAKTVLKVGDREMTVAEAIYLYQHGMDTKRALLNAFRIQLGEATRTVERENGSKLDDRADRYVRELYGSKDKADPDMVREAHQKFLEQNAFSLVDPLDIKSKIEELEKELDSFLMDVDAALQVSNATTSITFSY